MISSLRSHLSRLTQELSTHQALLTELRSLRDADAYALQAKSNDVDLLREQVERLAGEVEVLKGVVEEGLKERRMVREQSLLSHDEESAVQEPQTDDFETRDYDEASEASDSDGQVSPSRTPPRPKSRPMGRSARTDMATGGSSQPAAPFITSEEIDRISLDLSARQFSRSASPSLASSTGSQRRPGSSLSYSLRTEQRPQSPVVITPPDRVTRPSAPTPAHALNSGATTGVSKKPDTKEEASAPFPQIRGETLERLFFSAPEHNAHTCNVCQRRRRHEEKDHQAPAWLPSRFAPESKQHDDEDEGFEEGSDNHHRGVSAKGKRRKYAPFVDKQGNLPPQTVLARVLRELEDDFTHYKGYDVRYFVVFSNTNIALFFRIYVELSDQYKVMDAVSNVVKRNVVAEHLREVIDVLEQKVRTLNSRLSCFI